ncbi:hypothetical protein GOX01_16190 [Gluconobacter oxydans]|uniref:Nucleotidyltransferase-like protein n=1 Tax=Gluconobacter oxydans TaxID=442 RepID=A0AB35ANA8_GLUOY|nr:hypothetical protein [Gluconobacter oxydans]KXV31996.1 hypothetical protein AD939_04450 [Gluconobacter oxydans]MBF0856383.1 hypothetical protein [Gluconobacter oxydans]TCW26081.1 hypothetical protein EDC20_11160 [Gluconobacter oxydans]GEC61288.1 hypothetical protein GOX01_16190 [Gluconobacter oxydans]
MPDALEQRLIGELTTPVDPGVVAFADALARACPVLPLGVVFYGSLLRKADPDGILDFYIITENAAGFGGGLVARTGNLVLPPNVRYSEFRHDGRVLRAKIAVLSQAQFEARTRLGALDTTIWARFCQPVRLVWVRDPQSADAILLLIAGCVTTAACWTALLGDVSMTALEFWQTLFAHTYASELRVEKKGRGNSILEGQEARYAALLTLGWARGHLQFSAHGDRLEPVIHEELRRKATRRWALIQTSGRPRNVARLLKAAFTFENGASYLAWKIQRHTGFDMQLSPFESRHPLVMLPRLLWRARGLLGRSKA